MTTILDDAAVLIGNLESGIAGLKLKYESKQSERLISNHVWMQDHVQNTAKWHIQPLKNLFMKIKQSHAGDFKSSTNFDIAIKHCEDIERALENIIIMYKMRASYMDIKLKWQYGLPKLTESLKSLKNRFLIIKGQLSRKPFEIEESWF